MVTKAVSATRLGSKYPVPELGALHRLAPQRGPVEIVREPRHPWTPHPPSSLGHPLPQGERAVMLCPYPLPSRERMDRDRRFDQPARDG